MVPAADSPLGAVAEGENQGRWVGTVVEGQGPERTGVFGCVDCSVAFGVEAVEATDWLAAGGAARVGLRRSAGRVRAAPGRVADVVPGLQDGRRRTLVWNDGMLFHSAEWMTNS